MTNVNPPPKFGNIVNGRYVWDQGKDFPKYFKDGNEFLKQYLPQGEPGVFEYYMGDDERKLKESIKKMPDNWKYKTKKIEYTLNSLGYRGPEFDVHDWQNSIVVLGCSCVFGVGVSDDETLTHYLSKITGRNVINLGIGGGSNQLILDTSLTMKRNYGNPYSLITMWTCMDRLPYYGDGELYHIGLWNHILNSYDINASRYKMIFDNFYEDKGHENVTFYNIVQAMRAIWEDKTKYFEGSFFEPTAHYGQLPDYFPFSNNGRDLLHPGAFDHKKTANEIAEHCVNLYGKDYLQPGGLGLDIKFL
jgi:hypothetical protein